MAFHSTALDKEITAANHAGVCTSSVFKEDIDQPVSGSFLLRIKEKKIKNGNFFRGNSIKQEIIFLENLCSHKLSTDI